MANYSPPSYDEVMATQPTLNEDMVTKPSVTTRFANALRATLRKYTIEILMCVYLVSGYPMITIIGQWTYIKMGEEMGIDVDTNHHRNSTDNSSEIAVQKATTLFSRNLHLAGFVPQLIAPLIIGAISDKFGRKIMLLLPCISSLIMVTTYLSVMFFDLSIYWLYVNILGSFFGSYPVMMMGCYAYIADTVPTADRGFRMILLDVVGMLSGSVVNALVSYLVAKFDIFWIPLVGTFFIKILLLMYIIFVVPESLSEKSANRKFTFSNLLSGFKLFIIDNGTGRNWRLSLLLFSSCITDIVSSWGITDQYLMKSPRNWNSLLIGLYGSLSSVVDAFTVLIFANISYRLLSTKHRIIIGRVSSASKSVCISLAKSTAVLMIAPILGCLSFLASPMIRTLMTFLVAQDEQGAMLSMGVFVNHLFSLISTFSSAKIYTATVSTWDGCLYFITGMLQLVSALVVVLYAILTRHDPDPHLVNYDQDVLVVNDDDHDESDDIKELAY